MRVLRVAVYSIALALGVVLLRQQRDSATERSARAQEALGETADSVARALDSINTDALEPATERNPDVREVYSNLPAPVRDSFRIQFTIDARGIGTHLAELLETREGWSYRWPDRRSEPMRIWVQEAPQPGWRREFTPLVREAFSAWGNLGLPFLFTFTSDSTRAEILVTWVDRFAERMTGRTLWRHDQHGWIVGGNIQLALHLPDGRPVTEEGVGAIALHEVGHLIGLDHVSDSTSIMAPQVFVSGLNEADRRTARLVYDLPPGKIR